jgi:hypothetical protein
MPALRNKSAVPLNRGIGGKLKSAKAKIGGICSQAMSIWVKGRRSGSVGPETYAILGRCRSQAHMLKVGAGHRAAGSEAKAQTFEHRARRGLTAAQRLQRARELRGGRKAATTLRVPAGAPTAPGRSARPFGQHTQGLSKATSVFGPGAHDFGKRLFGPHVTREQVISLGGAPDDAHVEVLHIPGSNKIHLDITHPGYEVPQMRIIQRLPDGSVIVDNDEFILKEGFRGRQHADPAFHDLALRSIAREVETAHVLGVRRITAYAVRSNTRYIGYKVWPKYGFDGALSSPIKDRLATADLPPTARRARTIAELIKTTKGAQWWEQHGESIDLEFDLDRDSYSMKRLGGYLKKRLGPGKLNSGGPG